MKILGLLFLTSLAQAFTQVIISTGAPAGLETQFLAATTSQFNAKVVKNPLVPNTYAMTLYGLNPSYVVPSTATCFNIAVDIDTASLQTDLNALVQAGPAIISNPYLYGWGNGAEYQNHIDENQGFYMSGLCGNATNFTVINATNSWDTATCIDTLTTYVNDLYQLNLSTPTFIKEIF